MYRASSNTVSYYCDHSSDVRHYEIPDDNMPLQKYRDTGMVRYFVT